VIFRSIVKFCLCLLFSPIEGVEDWLTNSDLVRYIWHDIRSTDIHFIPILAALFIFHSFLPLQFFDLLFGDRFSTFFFFLFLTAFPTTSDRSNLHDQFRWDLYLNMPRVSYIWIDHLRNRLNFDLNKSRQTFHHSLKEHHKISNIPKFRCEML
jgi:hypothetical protein